MLCFMLIDYYIQLMVNFLKEKLGSASVCLHTVILLTDGRRPPYSCKQVYRDLHASFRR